MNDRELEAAWAAIQPTMVARRRMDARLAALLEARDTPLAAEWIALFRIAPFPAAGLVVAGGASIVTAPPFVWLVRSLM